MIDGIPHLKDAFSISIPIPIPIKLMFMGHGTFP